MDDLLQTFDAELRRSAEQVQSLLLSLGAETPAEQDHQALHECYRLTHSVKGAARVVGLSSVETLAHELEDRLQALVRGRRLPPPAETTAFLKVVDGFVDALDAFLVGDDLDPEPYLRLLAPAPRTPDAPAASLRPQTSAPLPPRRDDSVRVPTAGLDALARGIEEMLLLQARTDATLGRLEAALEEDGDGTRAWEQQGSALRRDVARLRHALVGLHALGRSFRLEPVERLRVPLQRALRDLSDTLGRPARLRLAGQHEIVDAAVLESLREPLVHLLRNAVDHGIEPPAERERAGKAREASVDVTARLAGSRLEIEVRDDGRGIDLERVRARSVERGIVPADRAGALGEEEWLQQVFAPGFSTAAAVSAVSGRGMGLDIVRERVRALGGDVDVASRPGAGTSFTLRVPLAVSTRRALVVRAGAQVTAIPLRDVEGVVRLGPELEGAPNASRHVRWQGLPVAVESLARRLGQPVDEAAEGTHAVVVADGSRRHALAVDEILEELEQPALPAPWNLAGLRWLGGVLPGADGSLLPLLDLRELLAAAPQEVASATPVPAKDRVTVLVTDDSATIRALHRSVLQAAGYDVVTADDGADALAVLQKTHVDLVLTDIQMPRLDGLGLVRRLRQVPAWRHLPVIVVSQYGREDDLRAASEAGADRYIVKSAFTPASLLDTVAELVG